MTASTEWPNVLFNPEFREKVEHAKLHSMRPLLGTVQLQMQHAAYAGARTGYGLLLELVHNDSLLPNRRSKRRGCLQLVLEGLAVSC
jgi:hypothetical protein